MAFLGKGDDTESEAENEQIMPVKYTAPKNKD